MLPSLFGSQAWAANSRAMRNAKAIVLGEIEYVKPTTLPQYINIFLYGGPSELAGNLSNIEDINVNSQNAYPTNLLPSSGNTIVTANNFWGGGGNGGGGETMEDMIAKGRMSIYRTINRIKDDTKAHRPSIFSNLTGQVGEEDIRPGIATVLAAVLSANNVIGDNAVFPFVTFEGESVIFNGGDMDIPLVLKPVSLDQDLRNPYQRVNNTYVSGQNGTDPALLDSSVNTQIENLAQSIASSQNERFGKVVAALNKRSELNDFINGLDLDVADAAMPFDPDDPATQLVYPDTNFGRRLRAAVNLAANNSDSSFLSLGSGGLGGWDDHDSGVDANRYPQRVRRLMDALNVAGKHLEALGKTNVFITVYGDFGRNVNLNNSMGWDHGNNQNLYTVSGSGIAGRQLGKIVGKTQRIGQTKVNRQFTSPTDDSYQCEPFSIASMIFKYFGVQNPEVITGEPVIDENATNEWVDPNA